ncbi:GNAT family N-acetyltransferase [Gordonia sp. HNM0687]|uniref:GNAT family N-acetyltransferase n=1 Tax=Gordonia mangrovi TaxID=2665643 RepID=A0A6L7GMS0_9ACTN|nr:GNAT family N-acetyltransferase [Gordonia mangrovi]MXP21234.1 GNAT family N-acetyltransferase [Gordonia mangrovi]UVF78237.1 GNAT family N-acetyltransferase [Gordonia mangrovi]
MTPITVASSRDLDVVSALLAQAFADDPVIRWMNPDPHRDKRIFHTLLRWAHGEAASIDLAVRDGVPVGAAVWDRPGHKLSAVQQVGSAVGFIGVLRGRVRRGAALEREFAKVRPRAPHWYLGQVGAVIKGAGVGSALLSAGIDRVDGPAYLESSNEVNIPLYERYGFSVTDEITLPMDGPKVWPMYRRG